MKYKALLSGLVIGIGGLIISPLNFALNLEENVGLDLLFRLRGPRPAPFHVAVVSIDRESADMLKVPDNPDKWPRSLHARLTENLVRAGAGVIVFDVHFVEQRAAEDDTLFAAALSEAGNVVLAEPLKVREVSLSQGKDSQNGVFNIVKIVKPLPLFAQAAVATAPFPLPRIPFKVNQYWTFQTGAGGSPTFPVVAFQLYTLPVYDEFIRLLQKVSPQDATRLPADCRTAVQNRDLTRLQERIRALFESNPIIAQGMLDELEHVSIDPETQHLLQSLIHLYQGSNSRYINFYGPPRTISTIPYHEALQQPADSGTDYTLDVKGKTVFVGLSEKVLADRKDSFYTVFSEANGIFISGVEIAATAFANLLEDRPVQAISVPYYIVIILLWGVCLGVICRMMPLLYAALGVAAISTLYLMTAVHQFNVSAIWFPITVPLFLQAPIAFFGGVLWNYIDTNKERQKIRKAFEYYLPKHVVAQLAKNISHVETGSQVVYGICLATDAEHYTTLSETMDPQELAGFMKRYYTTLFTPTKQHGGTVTDIIGDAMMSLWVSSHSDLSLKNKACSAALDIQKSMEGFNQSSTIKLNTRVGLHYGQIWLGHIGAVDRYEYTVVGDIVNTAARIEGLNKYLDTQVLASDEVVQHLDGFLTREVGAFRLKGKTKAVVIHEVVCRSEHADEPLRSACAAFGDAMDAFRKQLWDEAQEKFNQCANLRRHDGPSRFYLSLCERYREHHPGDPWDAVVNMEEK